MADMKLLKPMGPVLRKERKKQVNDELDRIKLAEKKRRRLEKALAASAAIRSELEKKKQKKIEEQRRLDEEGAAIAEAVALHVLLEEKPEDSTADVFDEKGSCGGRQLSSDTYSFYSDPCNAGLIMHGWNDLFTTQRHGIASAHWTSGSHRSGGKHNEMEHLFYPSHSVLGHEVSISNSKLNRFDDSSGSNSTLQRFPYERFPRVAEISGIIASQAVASLKIAEDVRTASFAASDSAKKSYCLW